MENNNPNPNQSPAYIPDTKVETKSHLDKLAEVFLPADLDSIGNRIYNQVIIPMILKTAGDIIHRSIDMIFGTTYTGPVSQPKSQGEPADWTTYRQPSTTSTQQPGTMQIFPVRSGVYDYSIIRFKTIQDAQHVLNNMRAQIQTNGFCSVGRYLEFAKAKTISEDYNYGWMELNNVNVEENKAQEYPYRIMFPNPQPLYKQNQNRYFTL